VSCIDEQPEEVVPIAAFRWSQGYKDGQHVKRMDDVISVPLSWTYFAAGKAEAWFKNAAVTQKKTANRILPAWNADSQNERQ
jgi:hypothetical protein